jgi:hypothetical protein
MIRRSGIILSIFFFLSACTSPPNPFGLPPGIESPFSDKAEFMFLKAYPKLAQRDGKTLTLRFPNGRTEAFEDKGEAECEDPPPKEGSIAACYIAHRVIGYWPERSAFLVSILFYEGSANMLVHNDGVQTGIEGLPEFAPGGTVFSAWSDDCSHFFWINMQIWRWDTAHPIKQFDDRLGVCIDRVKWLSDTRLRVYMNNGDVPENQRQFWSEILVMAADGRWRWTESDERRKVQDISVADD